MVIIDSNISWNHVAWRAGPLFLHDLGGLPLSQIAYFQPAQCTSNYDLLTSSWLSLSNPKKPVTSQLMHEPPMMGSGS